MALDASVGSRPETGIVWEVLTFFEEGGSEPVVCEELSAAVLTELLVEMVSL